MNDFKAFTFAEVLITLGVIGVVATLTLPIMINNINKKQTIERVKTAYSIFSDAIRLSYTDNGEISGEKLTGSKKSAIEYPEMYLIPYIKGIKRHKGNFFVYSLSEVGGYHFLHFDYAAVYEMPNGMYFSAGMFVHPAYYSLVVDVNGAKGPNVAGIDTFEFWIDYKNISLTYPGKWLSNDRLIGNCKNDYGCCIQSTANYYAGYYCTAKLIADGWEMKSDYPWNNGKRPR